MPRSAPKPSCGLRSVESKLQLDAAVTGVRSVESVLRLSKCCVRPAAAQGRPTDHSRRQINKRRQIHRQHRGCSHAVQKKWLHWRARRKAKVPEPQIDLSRHSPLYNHHINQVHLVTALHRTQRSSPNSSLVHEPSADHDTV